jgi:hypothetical protein
MGYPTLEARVKAAKQLYTYTGMKLTCRLVTALSHRFREYEKHVTREQLAEAFKTESDVGHLDGVGSLGREMLISELARIGIKVKRHLGHELYHKV